MSTKQDAIEFTKNLVKGRIAETIFEQMLLATENYTVLKGGYEDLFHQIYKRVI